MPQIKRRKRKGKGSEPVKDETESESGCLSNQLSRTRLGKENLSSCFKTPKQTYSNPYDGDIESELELLDVMPSSPMAMDHTDSEPGESGNIMDTLSQDADHSTPHPAISQIADDGCFGFESLDSPIPFSPIVAPPNQRPLGIKGSTYIYPRKRKKVVPMFDIPIEEKKVVKKKRQMKTTQIELDEDWAGHLNDEFEEINKVKLVIE